jgi:hypothetical protein
MPSKVYFFDLKAETADDGVQTKIKKLFTKAGFDKFIEKGDLTAIKAHFGEWGNTTFVPPWYIQPMVEEIKKAGGNPFLTDTNTLYNYKRRNAVDHLKTAYAHGFAPSVVGAPVIIADGLLGRNYKNIEINKKHFKSVKIGADIAEAQAIIVSSHFKGHMMAGFGGAIKNLGMGSGSVEGKKEMHSMRPVVDFEECTGCGTCAEVCPVSTIEIMDGKSIIDLSNCIGCGECFSHCPDEAIKLDWETEIPEFNERMVEYAYGVWKQHKNKIGFINFVINVTPECDCFNFSQRTIVRDVGILASKDPVALDKACYDLVNQQPGLHDSLLETNFEPGEDKFKGLKKTTMGELQLSYGEEIGLGTQNYELIKL